MSEAAQPLEYPGTLDDGTHAPPNTDSARLDYMERKPGLIRNLKRGVYATNVPRQWQPGIRAAVDAAMETERREIAARGHGEARW